MHVIRSYMFIRLMLTWYIYLLRFSSDILMAKLFNWGPVAETDNQITCSEWRLLHCRSMVRRESTAWKQRVRVLSWFVNVSIWWLRLFLHCSGSRWVFEISSPRMSPDLQENRLKWRVARSQCWVGMPSSRWEVAWFNLKRTGPKHHWAAFRSNRMQWTRERIP